jgi:hypothetical protein
MQGSIIKCALAGCAVIAISGCAMQQNTAPEYRLSSSATAVVPGSSMLQSGRTQLDAGMNALAIEAFRAEIRANPDSADAYNGLAVAYGRIGRDDLAQRYFETALAREPGNRKAQTNLAKLTGNVVPQVELAMADIPAVADEPVAVTFAGAEDPIGELIDKITVPALASSLASLPSEDHAVAPVYTLAKQGVLSKRFAIASARVTMVAIAPKIDRSSGHDSPAELPKLPEPALPTGYPPVDYRTGGNRLVRLSLGEVHLVTRPEPAANVAKRPDDFESFGTRLAAWLPQSIAIEQASSRNNAKDNAVLMAAIERAEQNRKLASATDIVLPEMPEFTYLSFGPAGDAGSV